MQVPDRGDFVLMDFDPQSGHEQAGNRPALVLSPSLFNEATGFAVVCPITLQQKDYPFEVPLPEGLFFEGVVLTDQVKSIDWRSRRLKVKSKAPIKVIDSCLQRIHTVLFYEL